MWRLAGPLSGCRFRVRNDEEGQYVLADPCYEPEVCRIIEQVVRPGMTCADVGANIGYITLLLAKCCSPWGKVYAFEAVPSNADQARENISINGLSHRVVVENFAVSDKSASGVLLYEGDSTFEFSLLPRSRHTGGIEVSTIALDDYFGEESALDFVKVDIEGAEEKAVNGMRNILSNQRPTLLIEIHDERGCSAVEHLIASRYSVFDLEGRPVGRQAKSASISHVLAVPCENLK